ncbi:MAG: double-cubane-cluster-containing anaerobic reductase [Candidatus Avilachnospira sp.]|jgi:benzoyl-CoA reductase/2-hydroxyglutaryl-CoA dehydratase subunit BcrC/BadD/HgdB
MQKLPENFETYDEARQKGFLRLKGLKDSGQRVVGLFCSYVPTELIYAADAIPVSLCANSEEPIAAGETRLPANLCPLIKASYGFALTDTCPYFYFSDFVVGETTCDGKKKMFELLNDIKETFVMYLPNGREPRDAAINAWRNEIIRFKEKLEDFYHITISEEKIREAIRLKNREREAFQDFLELGMLIPPALSGYELGTKADASSFTFKIEERISDFKKRTEEALEYWNKERKGKSSDRPRIMVTGCPNGGVRDKLLKTIEELGGDIVIIDTCGGLRNQLQKVREEGDVYTALAEKYLDVTCSVMSPNQPRFDMMGKFIDDFHIDAVVEIILQACHTFNVESYNVKRYVTEEKGLPYLCLESDYSQADKGQFITRIEAFLEMLS